jgi:hypothetical protein
MIRKEGPEKNQKHNITIFAVIGVISVIMEPIMKAIGNMVWGGDYYAQQYTFNSIGEFFAKLGWAAMIGKEQPLFPFLATAMLGSVIGMVLSREKVPQDLPKKGIQFGAILVLIGAIVLVLEITVFDEGLDAIVDTPHYPGFFLFLNGLETMFYMFVLKQVEFNPKIHMDRFIKRTELFRRWGQIALTIYIWEMWIEFPVRDLMSFITGYDFHYRGLIKDFWPTILVIGAVLLVWDIVIRLWERKQFKGSLEWLMANVVQMSMVGKAKLKEQQPDRMNIRGILYEPEPVMFLTASTSGEMIEKVLPPNNEKEEQSDSDSSQGSDHEQNPEE